MTARSPLIKVFLLFMVGIILPTGFLVYLGIASIRAETKLLRKESEERVGQTLQAMQEQTAALITASRREADGLSPRSVVSTPSGITFLIALDPDDHLLYPIRELPPVSFQKRPSLPEHLQDHLRKAEEAEFKDRDYARALAAYQSLEHEVKPAVWKATLLTSIAGCLNKLGRPEAAETQYQEILSRYAQETDEHNRPFGLLIGVQLGELQMHRGRPALAVTNTLKVFQDLLLGRWKLPWEDEQFFARHLRNRLTTWQSSMSPADRRHYDTLHLKWQARQKLAEQAHEFVSRRWGAIQNSLRQNERSGQPLLILSETDRNRGLWVIPSFEAATGQRAGWIVAEISCQELWKRMAQTLEQLAGASQSSYRVALAKTTLFVSANKPEKRRVPLEVHLTQTIPPLTIEVGPLSDLPVQQLAKRRRNIYVGMVALAVLVILIALYATWYAVSREVEVAQLKARFVAGISHELKTPLSIIGLIGQKLKLGRVSSPAEAEEYYGMLAEETDRLKSLIDDVLDFSRMLENRRTYRKEPTDLVALIQENIDRFRRSLPEKEPNIRFEPAMTHCVLSADREAISRVLLNLLDNAVKYSPVDRLQITVSLRHEKNQVVLEVRDQGYGIPPDEQKFVFERFYRGKAAQEHPAAKGVGLGLSIVSHIVSAHNGTVELSSAGGQAQHLFHSSAGHGGCMNKILIVEDEAKMAKLLINDLKLEGYEVHWAADGDTGLEEASQPGWDLLILDVMLPKRDGYEVCRTLRAQGSRLPILMLTAKSQETDKVVGFQVGADDYLTKPFSILELVARVKALLRRVPGQSEALTTYSHGTWRIDFRRQEAWKDEKPIALTSKEFQILQYMIAHREKVISREQFLRELWQYEELPSTRTVDNQVASLRRKLGWSEKSQGPKILTIHNTGYRFVD